MFKLSQVECCHLVGSHLLPQSSPGGEVFREPSLGEPGGVEIVPVAHQDARLAVTPLHQRAPAAPEVPDEVGQALRSLQLPAPLLRDVPGPGAVEGGLAARVAGVESVVFLKINIQSGETWDGQFPIYLMSQIGEAFVSEIEE